MSLLAGVGLNIPITSSVDEKGFKAASKQIGVLEGAAKKLGGALAASFAAGAVANFAKDSVKAFTEVDKSLSVLRTTMGNQGIAIGMNKLGSYFDDLAQKTGKTKTELIPTFQSLINATGNFGKSQEFMNLALDISAATGKDVNTVAISLGKAYNGQTAALGRLGLGLSKATLAGKDFGRIQKQLTTKFGGAEATAANSFAGQMNRLKVTFESIKETVGSGIVDALKTAFNGTDLTNFQNAAMKIANYIANIVRGIGVMIKYVRDFIDSIPPWVKDVSKWIFKVMFPQAGALSGIAKIGAAQKKQADDMLASLDDQVTAQRDAYNVRKKLADQAAKDLAASKALTAQQQKQIQAAKDKLALDKASSLLANTSPIFDITAIERYAALLQTTNDADRARLQLMQDIDNLQKAISSGNAALATQMADTVKIDLFNLTQLQGGLSNLKGPDNPLAGLLADIYASIAALKELEAQMQRMSIAAGTLYISSTGESSKTTSGTWGQYYNGLSGGLYGSTPVNNNITYNIAGTVVSDQMLSQTLANNNASGINSDINRLNVTYA